MRKLLAWLGAATLMVICSANADAGVGTVLKPYVTLILDTSGSMAQATNFGAPGCGAHCSATLSKLCVVNSDCPGTETCVAEGDTKLNHAKCAINNIANSYGDIVFALGRFRNVVSGTTTADTFPTGCCAHGPGAGGSCGGTNTYSCGTNDNMFELVAPLVDGANSTAAKWVNFTGNTCDGTGTDPEIWNADSSTPLGGSLLGSQRYYQGLQATDGSVILTSGNGFDPILADPTDSVFLGPQGCDPKASCTTNCCTSQCRPYTVILLTDGVETCGGNAVNAATGMLTTEVHAVNVTSVARNTNVVTVTTATAHPFVTGNSIVIGNANDASFNGTFSPITKVDATHFTYAQSGGNTGAIDSAAGLTLYAALNDPIAISTIARAADGTVTVTTSATHKLLATQSVVIAGVTDTTFNGTFTIVTSPDTTHFTYTQALGVASSTGGTASHAAMLYRYRIETKVIGFGVTPGNGNIEAIAHAGGAPDVPNVNEGYYASNQADLELAISDIIAKSVRSETCNDQDDDCDTKIDEDFPNKNAACDNGEKGVCLVDGQLKCRSDGTGLACNAGAAACNGLPDGTACSVTNAAGASVSGQCNSGVCDPFIVQHTQTELCNGLDDDCDGLIDEGAGCCTVGVETCNGVDQDCDGVPDQTCRCSNDSTKPCNPAGPAVCGAGTCVCTPITRTCGQGTCLGVETCDWAAPGHWSGCTAQQACTGPGTGPDCGICDGADNDCDGVCDGFTVGCADPIVIATIARAGNVVTVTTANTQVFAVGQQVVIAGVTNATFNGTFAVASIIDENTFTYAQAGGAASSSGGTVGSPGNPGTDNPGDPSHAPIPENQCHPGQKTCPQSCAGTNSFGSCLGEIKPTTEVCDGVDNDCDNNIDEDFVPQACSSNCGVGMTVCHNGVIECNAAMGTTDNTCDNIDDDCDGKIDEDWVCDASVGCVGPNCCSCGTGTTCEQTKCINGVPTCVTNPPINQETCNCNDDDCDGKTDEGTLCGTGADCVQCQCAYRCNPGEFPCPLGKKCSADNYCINDPCYGVTCPDVAGSKQVCHDNGDNTAQCVDICGPLGGVTCTAPLKCFPPTGDCLPDDCTTYPDRCTGTQNCINGVCIDNPCQGVQCPTDQYCVSGQCYNSCADVECPTGQRCRLGTCETDPCGHACPFGKVCNDSTGQCIDDPCTFRDCNKGQWCNPNDGQCEDDACVGTACPDPTQVCKGGTCYDPADFQPDAGGGVHVTVGGGGCSTGGDGGLGIALVLLGLVIRRRARHGGAS